MRASSSGGGPGAAPHRCTTSSIRREVTAVWILWRTYYASRVTGVMSELQIPFGGPRSTQRIETTSVDCVSCTRLGPPWTWSAPRRRVAPAAIEFRAEDAHAQDSGARRGQRRHGRSSRTSIDVLLLGVESQGGFRDPHASQVRSSQDRPLRRRPSIAAQIAATKHRPRGACLASARGSVGDAIVLLRMARSRPKH